MTILHSLGSWDYHSLRSLLRDEPLPTMIVDLDIFDANTRRIAEIAQQHGKSIRLASKSIRVPALMRRIFEVGGDVFQGIMCFSVPEAQFLSEQGFDNILVAYPTAQPSDLNVSFAMTQSGKDITLMIDCPSHIDAIERHWRSQAGEAKRPIQVCVDIDMSYRPMGLHLGVQRSPVRNLQTWERLIDTIQSSPAVQLHGVMGYEAQIAGLGDRSPFSRWMNPIKRILKQASVRDVAAQRMDIARWLEAKGISIALFNGGGTGSLHTTTQEPWITEVTAGSGFLQSHLFDYYRSNQNQPAFCFALQVTRQPQPGTITCQSGGFIASGEIGPDKAPIPFLPPGLMTTATEGYGEVQTPLHVPPYVSLRLGDPVFFRPAKSGEIAEHFKEYLLKQGTLIVDRVRTYRGYGHCFY